jgi:hypothetical protein
MSEMRRKWTDVSDMKADIAAIKQMLLLGGGGTTDTGRPGMGAGSSDISSGRSTGGSAVPLSTGARTAIVSNNKGAGGPFPLGAHGHVKGVEQEHSMGHISGDDMEHMDAADIERHCMGE